MDLDKDLEDSLVLKGFMISLDKEVKVSHLVISLRSLRSFLAVKQVDHVLEDPLKPLKGEKTRLSLLKLILWKL